MTAPAIGTGFPKSFPALELESDLQKFGFRAHLYIPDTAKHQFLGVHDQGMLGGCVANETLINSYPTLGCFPGHREP